MTSLQESLEERGFAIIPDLILENEIFDLSIVFSQSSLRRGRAGVRHAMKIPSVTALANGSKLLGIAKDILGGEAVPFRATLFDKSAEANWLVAVASRYSSAAAGEKGHAGMGALVVKGRRSLRACSGPCAYVRGGVASTSR